MSYSNEMLEDLTNLHLSCDPATRPDMRYIIVLPKNCLIIEYNGTRISGKIDLNTLLNI